MNLVFEVWFMSSTAFYNVSRTLHTPYETVFPILEWVLDRNRELSGITISILALLIVPWKESNTALTSKWIHIPFTLRQPHDNCWVTKQGWTLGTHNHTDKPSTICKQREPRWKRKQLWTIPLLKGLGKVKTTVLGKEDFLQGFLDDRNFSIAWEGTIIRWRKWIFL